MILGVRRARAMAMDYAGQMKMMRGDPAAAAELLEKSRTEWATLVRRGDGGAEAVQGYAVNCKMLGEAVRGLSPERERQAYSEGLALLDTLRVKNGDGKARLAWLRSMLETATGTALYRSGDAHGALIHLDAGAALAKEAVDSDPNERGGRVQAVSAFTELARYYLRVRDLDAALAQARVAVTVAGMAVQHDRDDADAWNLVGEGNATLLMVYSARSDWPAAEQAARDQLQARQLVSRRDPQNPGAKAGEGKAHDDLAFTLSNQDKMETAAGEFSEAITIFAGLIQEYPARNDWRRDLALVFKRRGDLWFQVEEWEETLKDYERCRYLRAHVAAATPEDATALMELANIRLATGEVFWKQGKLGEAAKAFDEAQEQLDTPVLPANHREATQLRESVARAIRELAEARAGTARSPSQPPGNSADGNVTPDSSQ